MKNRSPLFIIFGIVFIDLVGFGIVIPVLPLYGEKFGASPIVIGFLVAVYSLMQALCAPILGKISDRVGRRPVLLLSLIGTSIGFLIIGIANTLPILFLGRIIDGMTGGNISTAQAVIADVTPPEQRSRSMGLIGAAFGLGFVFGPAIGGLLSHFSLAAPFLCAAGMAALNAVAVACFLPESLPPEKRGHVRRKMTIQEVFQESEGSSLRFIVAAYFFTTVAFSLLTATYPLFTERRFGYTAAQNGVIFACQGLLSAVIQGGLLGWILKVMKDQTLTVIGAMILAVSFFFLPTSSTMTRLLLATGGAAIGHGLVAVTLNGLASKSVGPLVQGRVLGVMQSAASVARIVGPVLGGWLLTYDTIVPAHYGRTAYWAGGLVTIAAFLISMVI